MQIVPQIPFFYFIFFLAVQFFFGGGGVQKKLGWGEGGGHGNSMTGSAQWGPVGGRDENKQELFMNMDFIVFSGKILTTTKYYLSDRKWVRTDL